MISGPPGTDVDVPRVLRDWLPGDRALPVWRNELGGLTFATDVAGERVFVKWAPAGCGVDLSGEGQRMRWAAQYTPVPTVLDQGGDSDGEWLVTRALPGENAIEPRWIGDPGTAVVAIGRGLRAMHDSMPVTACPFDWSTALRVARAERAGRDDPARWHPVHQYLSLAEVRRRMQDPPPIDRLVVCHGDACAPNTLIADDGECCGHVDLGALGVADRWADIAVATWSAEWNYGPGWEPTLLDAYGIGPDRERTAYYRLLWDVSA